MYSFKRKMRRGVKSKNGGNKTDGGYLFTHFCFDFEQVNFKALLYLTCLFLGCCFFSTEIGDLFRRHTGIRPPLLSPEAMVSETLGLVNLSHVPRALNRSHWFYPPPSCMGCQALFCFTRIGTQSWKPINATYLHAVNLKIWVKLS